MKTLKQRVQTKSFRAKVDAAKVEMLTEELRLANKLIDKKKAIKLLTPKQRKEWVTYYVKAGDLAMEQALFLVGTYPGADKPVGEMAAWRCIVDAARFFWCAGQLEKDRANRLDITTRLHAALMRLKQGVDNAVVGVELQRKELE